jgi:hypothetical protein
LHRLEDLLALRLERRGAVQRVEDGAQRVRRQVLRLLGPVARDEGHGALLVY